MEEVEQILLKLTAEVVSAYVGNNAVQAADVPELIEDVYEKLRSLGGEPVEEPVPLEPAVSIKKSVTPDYIICLEDGKKYKSLKRHLRTQYDMTPEEYREKWSLPRDYPMVAPNYAAERTRLAKAIGLGQRGTDAKKANGLGLRR